MSVHTSLGAHPFIAVLLGLSFFAGAWSLVKTPVADIQANMMSGGAQRQYEQRFEESFPLRDSVQHTWAAFKFGVFNEVSDGAIVGKADVLFTSEEFTAPRDVRDFRTELQSARDRIHALGGELIPIILPDKARMMAEALPKARSRHYVERYDQLLEIIAAEGLKTVDLRGPLSVRGSYMVTDTHWSPTGAKAVAAEIGGLLEGSLENEAPFGTRRTGVRSFDGDLLVFAPTGTWRSVVGPVFEQIETFETSQSENSAVDLFAEVETPIVVVGTSFSARNDFHFVGFLKSQLKADVVSFAMEGRGPFVPMDQFLRSDGLITIDPKFVLWEIPERYLKTWSNTQ